MFFLTACGISTAWISLLVFDQPSRLRVTPAFSNRAGRVLALTLGLAWCAVLFASEYGGNQPSWPLLVCAALTFVALYGVLDAFFIHGPRLLLPTAILLQACSLLLLLLMPLGFGASDWGFDVADELALSSIYLLATLGGAATAFVTGWHKLGWFQLLAFIPAAFLLILAEQAQGHLW